MSSEGAPLIGGKRKNSNKELSKRIRTNCILLGVLLVALVGCVAYYQIALMRLEERLQSEETKTATLQKVVKNHASVIQRFNSSVTNHDVLEQLTKLEEQMYASRTHVEEKIKNLEIDVSNQLKQTTDELAKSVSAAEHEINAEVEMVKKDVESYVRTTQDQFSMENSFMIYQLAMTFMLISCLISMWHMTAHLRKFNQPFVQRKILAILWMCPIYAITSWFSLVFHEAEPYLAVLKDFYEAYIIYQFLSFCIAVLGKGDRSAVIDLLVKRSDHLTPPFRFDGLCNPNPYESDRAMAEAVLLQCQRFAMQFVFLRPTTTVALFLLEEFDYHGPTGDNWDYRSPQLYIIGLQNFSVFIAFTGLLKFYHTVDKELAWCRPFAKFLCIKGVVFMTFWQGLAISILATTTDVGGNDEEKWARSAQNFLICLEMLLFSIAHFYTFPTAEWEPGYRVQHEKQSNFSDTIAIGDFFQDLKLILAQKKRKKKAMSNGDDDSSMETIKEDEEDPDEENAVTEIKKVLEDVDDKTAEEITKLADLVMKENKADDEGEHGTDTLPTENTSLLQDNRDQTLGVSALTVDEEDNFVGQISETDGDSLYSENEEILKPSIFTSFGKK
mmetsp:Transcript_21889/g.33117  ORF Transcript_21889/g.33117 Transcript_21889/m.33117 type:complete len:613 (-) Transcript_21889:303-2141(-)|eukprot:CAMPEP_0178907602 /NCGR_PEP_ID=MMETSP0786-20121207/7461_1 /TAXON_ID=186022 /ORGANISM="Thalassionema frauenfeldii, Strain CCMP 1798" /LENGTH=612 /DNA_ID=CAMNT_0020579417 /DNA_START=1 /DNA_END=1839 /DNA_ORIENTATION=+